MRMKTVLATLVAALSAPVMWTFLSSHDAARVYASCAGNPSCPTITNSSQFPLEVLNDWTCDSVDVTTLKNNPSFERRFRDIYSWKAFVALMRPAQKTGTVWAPQLTLPTPAQTQIEIVDPYDSPNATGTNEYVPYWATWKNRPDLFKGTQPKTVGRFDIDADGRNATLFDANSKQVFYEIRVNSVVEAKISTKNLDTRGGQENFAKRGVQLQFTPSQCPPIGSSLIEGPIELKLAWKELDPQKDKLDHYLKRTLTIQDPTGTLQTRQAGLVGMHLTQQTRDHMTWIWSTFEHVDNEQKFFDPTCSATNCPENDPPLGGKKTVRLKRIDPIAQETEDLNKDVTNNVFVPQNSVLQYYKLIGTQYVPPGVSTGTNANIIANMKPPLLRNLVIEPYTDKSSCIGCHLGAQIPSVTCSPPTGEEGAEERDKTPRVSANFSLFIQNGPERRGLCP